MTIEKVDMPLFEEIQAVLAEIFETDAQEVSVETQFGDLPKWDSMGHMDLMVSLESQFGVQISAESISELISVPAILAHIQGMQSDS
jgi:acyl carrier protein